MRNSPPEEDAVRRASALDRFAASRDLWPLGTLDALQGRLPPEPSAVMRPANAAEVAEVLRRAAEVRASVVPYGLGSGVCGAARPIAGGWALDLKRLDHIGAVDTTRWVVDVGAGVVGQHLEDELAARGWTCGHSPSSIGCSSVGGWVAARSAGQFSSRYGVADDFVVGLDAVAPGIGAFHVGLPGPDSPTYRGPDQWFPLLVGSEGTLAVVTAARLRVWPLPKRRVFRGFAFDGVSDALDTMRHVMQGDLAPAVLRLYDPVDTLVGGRTKPKKGKRQPGSWRRAFARLEAGLGRKTGYLALPLALPRVLNRIADSKARKTLLVAGWEGDDGVVDALSAAGLDILGQRGEDLGSEPGERWYASRHAVSYKLMPIFERGAFADTMEMAAPWSRLEPLYHRVRAAIGEHAGVMAHFSHMYPEGGSVYFSFAGVGDRDRYESLWRTALDACLEVGGTVTHHHGVGLLKADAASREVGPAVAGWRELKRVLDPDGLMAPGRLFREVPGGPVPALDPAREDGLLAVAVSDPVTVRTQAAAARAVELRWPWDTLPGPPVWARAPWQSTVVAVAGHVGARETCVGRGPKSAAGSDLREWVASRDPSAKCTVAIAEDGERWMGVGEPAEPWAVALDLLRSDLRPAVLTVEHGVLRVGFRGPAAEALGKLASVRVPGGLTPAAWSTSPMPSDAVELCDPSDPRAVAVCPQGVLRRRDDRDR